MKSNNFSGDFSWRGAAADAADEGAKAERDADSLITTKNWIRSRGDDENVMPLISANERTSLNALISYVAMHSGENEFRVERRLSDRFKIANMTCLPAAYYDAAICYLVDGMNVIGNA